MKKTYLLILFLSICACGKDDPKMPVVDPPATTQPPTTTSPTTTTPSAPTEEEQKEQLETNLVGKWDFTASTKNTSCSVAEIQFFANRLYSLKLSKNEGETVLYRGKFDLAYRSENDSLKVDKMVLMDNDYVSNGSLPDQGSIATLTELQLGESSLQLHLQLGSNTVDFCGEPASQNLDGTKAEDIAAGAAEGSNHFLIQQEWRWVGLFDVGEGDRSPETPHQNLCDYLAEGFNKRCRDQNGELIENCHQTGSFTVLYSAYGTAMLSYFNPQGELFYTRQDYWRWKEDTAKPYSALEFRLENQTFEETAVTRHIIDVTENSLSLQISGVYVDDDGVEHPWTVQDSFILSNAEYSPCPAIDE